MVSTPPSVDLAIRLADEGIPLRAIARATLTPSAAIRDTLYQAKDEGRLVALPREDWPPGFPRDQRALQISRLISQDKPNLYLTVQQLFGLARIEVQLLLTLIQHEVVSKDRDDMAGRTMDVHICSMRKRLRPFKIKIITLWGFGFQLSLEDRRRAMDLILARVAGATAL